MFDPEDLEKDKLAQQGLKFLHESGIIGRQKLAMQQRLVAGNASAPDEELVKEVRDFRSVYNILESLQLQAEQYSKEGE